MPKPKRVPADVPKFLRLLQTLSEHALSLGKPDDFWPLMARELCRYFSCERATLFQASGGERLVSCYAQGMKEPIAVEPGEGIAGHAARARESCVCNDPYGDARFSQRFDRLSRFKTENILAVPLIAQDKVVGLVELINKEGGFTPDDAALTEFLGSQIATYFVLFRIERQQDQMTLQMLQMDKMAAMGRLVAGFTHEVRNPLSVILGYTEKLQGQLQQPEALEDLARIKKNGKRIEELVKNLLGFSRASKATIGSIDLGALIDTTLELVLGESKWNRIEILKDFEPNAPLLTGNVNTLIQVFLNLIVNALQAMDGQERPRLLLRIHSSSDRKYVVAEVTDNGPGIAAEIRDNIFEPFFTTKGTQGAGLGLYIVKGIVEDHGGSIKLDSIPGKGSAFSLVFPVDPSE